MRAGVGVFLRGVILGRGLLVGFLGGDFETGVWRFRR